MTSLREKYFPQHLNKLAAHVALFRALPGSQLLRIIADITSLTQSQPAFEISATNTFRMKRGVGIYVDDTSGCAKAIYQGLRKRWEPFLSQQDRSFKAHYTVQNKVEETLAEQTLQELGEQFRGSQGQVLGLSLYRYDRGFWKKEQDFPFTGKGKC
jgi:2'-5' RNA ligase